MNMDAVELALKTFLGEKQLLLEALTRAHREGTEAKRLARLLAPAFGRDQVQQYLAAIRLHDSARRALSEAGLGAHLDVYVTGIESPREARLCLAADPAETPHHADLPRKIRAALRDFHLTLDVTRDFPRGEDDRITDSFVDEVLLDGEPVRLVKAQPLT